MFIIPVKMHSSQPVAEKKRLKKEEAKAKNTSHSENSFQSASDYTD